MSMPMDKAIQATPSRWASRARPVRIAARATEIPARVRWALLLFVFSVPIESITLSEDITITKAFGYVFLASVLTCPRLFRLRFSPAAWWFLGYLTFVFVSGALLPREFLRQFATNFLTLLQLGFLFVILSNMLRDENLARKVLLTFAIAVCILALGSLLGFSGFSTGVRKVTPGRGTVLEYGANYAAVLMAMAAVILIGLRLDATAQPLWQKILLPVLTLLPLGLLVYTTSRSGAAAFIIGASLYLLPYRAGRHKTLAILLGMAAVIGMVYVVASHPIFSERWQKAYYEGNLSSRDKIWSAAIEMISEKPFLGWQPVISEYETDWRLGSWGRRATHSLYFHLLLEVGVIGAIPFLIGLALCARAAWKARAGVLGMLPLALLATMVAYNMALSGTKHKPLWIFLGLVIAAGSSADKLKNARIAILFRGRASGANASRVVPSNS